MKNRLINICIISLMILGALFGVDSKSYAQNATNEALTNESSNAETTSEITNKKSSNANLKNLGIKPHDFTGFRYGKTTYDVTVPEITKTIEVYAEVQDSKAKVSGTGTKTLEEVKTSVDVVVTAEDGTKKTYTINITRSDENQENNGNEGNDEEENSNGLLSLKINELNLTPDFKTNIYEYSVKYIGEDTKLDIKAEPTNDDYTVEVLGNDNLKEGENILTILVSEAKGDNIATYQITVNKSLIDEEAVAKEEAQKKENQKKIIIGGIIAAVIVIFVIFIIVKRKKDEEYDEEFSEDTYYESNEEREVPKALNKKSRKEKEYEEMDKENIRQKFLDDYNSNIDYEDEMQIKAKHKGKRFK